jgi:hypothetical protein
MAQHHYKYFRIYDRFTPVEYYKGRPRPTEDHRPFHGELKIDAEGKRWMFMHSEWVPLGRLPSHEIEKSILEKDPESEKRKRTIPILDFLEGKNEMY